MPVKDKLVHELAGDCEVIVDAEIIESYRRDQAAPGMLDAGMPAAVARPRSTVEVQAAVRCAAKHQTPVVVRGAGSGLSGGANAIDGCLVISMERMDKILDVDPTSMTATVQAGVLNAALKEAAASQQLWYAPDPASYEFSTIGGNVATNAGGLCCLRYGVTREALLAIEVVLADGQAVRLGHRTRKGVTGYDLVGLMCGSEGTLGIITEATVRLLAPPNPVTTIAATFANVSDAARTIAPIVQKHAPSLLELIDATTIAAVEDMAPMGLDDGTGALLFVQIDTDPAAIAELCEQAGATYVAVSDDRAEGEMLLAARRLAYPALERLGSTQLDDVSVPLGRIPDLIDGVTAIAAVCDLTIGTFGHAGDGNMHPTVVYDHLDPDQARRAHDAFNAITELALELGGTITGEHGVGVLKLELAERELGSAHELHRSIKGTLDPSGLLNPGKAI